MITIFRWSIFKISSLALILLWAFNPLGSQASIRGVYLRSGIDEEQGRITYYSPNVSTQVYLTPFDGWIGLSRPTIRAVYSSAIFDPISSTQYVDPSREGTRDIINMLGGDNAAAISAAMDTWNNVRIPSLESLTDYSAINPHRWLDTAWHEKVMNYSGLIGDRVEGLNRSLVGNISFAIQSSYQNYNVSAK